MKDEPTPAQLNKLAKAVQRGHKPTGCAVPGCPIAHHAVHLCYAHYRRLQRWRKARGYGRITYKPLLAPLEATHSHRHADGCLVKGCPNKYHARGLCHTHYEHARRCTMKGTNE